VCSCVYVVCVRVCVCVRARAGATASARMSQKSMNNHYIHCYIASYYVAICREQFL